MAATDARPVPIKNTAFRYYFSIRKSDGTLITSWTGADSEVSLDGASFSDCTNEATEIGTSGVGYLDLTSSEMNADAVSLKITVTNTSALTLVVTFFPQEAGDIKTDVETIKSQAVTCAASVTVYAHVGTSAASTAQTGDGYAIVNNGTHGNAALKTLIDTLDDYVDAEVAAIKAKTDNLPASPAATGDIPSAGAIADAVWDETLADHVTGGTTGAGLNAAGSAGDPWSTALPGAYTAGSAGYILGTNLNATVSSRSSHSEADVWSVATRTLTAFGFTVTTSDAASITAILEDTGTTLPAQISGLSIPSAATNASAVRMELATELARLDVATSTRLASASYTAPDNASITAILEDTGTTIPAQIAALSIPTTTQIADAVLSRNVSNVEGSAGEHTLCTLVLAGLESSVSGTTWTIKRTDGATTHAAKTVAVDAAADPITGVS